ncbi:MAG TPA: hypothetical protein VHY19_07280 [Steroidobacteraceae bacterium]|jgi:hypothetical protein|nr:hypothetical protein [Steroidobacteraceae bacterium]
METLRTRWENLNEHTALRVLLGALLLLWAAIRLPVTVVLAVLEPFVTTALSVLAALGILVALFLRLIGEPPHFPFWGIMAASIGCVLLLALYYLLMLLVARGSWRLDD